MQSYMSTDQMINYLKTQKKIIVDDEDRHWLDEVNYMNLINPYKDLFSSGKNPNGKFRYKYPVNLKEYIKVFLIESNFSHALYIDIRNFERKFKNIIFDEICKEYVDKYNDIFCTLYIEEIEDMLNGFEAIPMFCINMYKTLTKTGYKENMYDVQKRVNLLKKIYMYGSSSKYCNDLLLKHYNNTYYVVPLWIIPNILTLGEIIMIYTMLDVNIQNNIYKRMNYNSFIKENRIIEYRKIYNFYSKLEQIRKTRNIISHFGSLTPFIVTSIKKPKEINNSLFIQVLKLLHGNQIKFNDESFREYCKNTDVNFISNNNNLLILHLLEIMEIYTK